MELYLHSPHVFTAWYLGKYRISLYDIILVKQKDKFTFHYYLLQNFNELNESVIRKNISNDYIEDPHPICGSNSEFYSS